MSPTVTIGMPTYNRADRFLRPARARAQAQTWQELEVVVPDNCPEDNTKIIFSSYSDPRRRYVRQERIIGANAIFNYCLKHARGDYFLLYHDDDVADPDRVSICKKATEGVSVSQNSNRTISERSQHLAKASEESRMRTHSDESNLTAEHAGACERWTK